MDEPTLIALGPLALAVWAYYQDVYLQKLELHRSRVPRYIIAALVCYLIVSLTLPYIKTHVHNDKFQILIAVVGLVWAAVAITISYRNTGRKQETLESVARQLGLNYDPKGNIPLPAALIQIPTFDSVGEGVTHVLRENSPDQECAIFEHRYSFGEGTVVAHTIAAYRISSLVPEFQLKPENVLDKFVAAFGGTDVDFPTHPTFSSAYRLVCSDEDESVIRQMFSRSLCSLFEREQGWTIGGKGNWVGMYKHRILVESHNLSAFYQKTKNIAKSIEAAVLSVNH